MVEPSIILIVFISIMQNLQKIIHNYSVIFMTETNTHSLAHNVVHGDDGNSNDHNDDHYGHIIK